MMNIPFLFLVLCCCLSFVVQVVRCENVVFVADITPINNSSVIGTVVVFTGMGYTIAYAGFAAGLEEDLVATNCTAENGCGVHIHNGTSCESKETQGGHYYDSQAYSSYDPWNFEKYSSNSTGGSVFGGVLNTGFPDVVGKPFIVHSKNGSRVGCGILTPSSEYYKADVAPLPNSSSFATVWGYKPVVKEATNGGSIGNDMFCFLSVGENLKPSLDSVLGNKNGTDCDYENGCGVHIHNGTSCANKETQGGHYYDPTELSSDPWVNVSYRYTSDSGVGSYATCVSTGDSLYSNRPFILHSETGSRVACGLLKELRVPTGSSSGSYQVLLPIRFVVTAILSAVVYNLL